MTTIASWAHAPSTRGTWALGQVLLVVGVIAAFVLVPVVSSASRDGGIVVAGLGVLAAMAGVELKHHVQRQRAAGMDAAGDAGTEAPPGFVVIALLVMGTLSLYYCTR